MRNFAVYLLSIVASVLLAGCGAFRQAQGDMPPIGAPGAMPESETTASSNYQVLYSFSGKPDGQTPLASLIDVKGALYGTTSLGGERAGGGTVFTVSTTGVEHVLHSFRSRRPFASLIDMGGILYGTTKFGGLARVGTVFSVTTSGKLRLLYTFAPNNDGELPVARLLDLEGTLYGTTSGGGSYTCGNSTRVSSCGTVFSIAPGGTENILHSFGHGTDGQYPEAGLIDVHGTLYGTTYAGGAGSGCGGSPGCASGPSGGCSNGCGTVFSVTKDGTEKVLHRFSFGSADGSLPEASLIDVKGTLYGTTFWGGTNEESGGTVFSISTSGTEKILHNFGSGSDGANPSASLIDVNGTLYGTTLNGGKHGRGTVFSISTSGAEKVLHDFGSGSDGAFPLAGLTDVNGTLYGTTAQGGAYTACNDGCGTVFALTL